MDRFRPDFCHLGVILALGFCGVLAGCGDDEPAVREADPGTWSAPTAPVDPGSPDGDGTTSAVDLVTRLHDRIARGEGNSGPTYQQDVESVAAVLWGAAGEPADGAAAQVHIEACSIAGEVCRWLTASDDARAQWTKSHPLDVALHDAHVGALAAGPDAYKAWCAEAGSKQLTRLKEARYKKLFEGK